MHPPQLKIPVEEEEGLFGEEEDGGSSHVPPHVSFLPRVPLVSEAPRGQLEASGCRAGGVRRAPPVPLARRAPR